MMQCDALRIYKIKWKTASCFFSPSHLFSTNFNRMTANGTTERSTDIGCIEIALSADRNTDGDVFVDGENDLPLQKDEHLDAAASERDKASAKLKRNRLLFGRVQGSIDNNISKPAPRDYPVWKKRLIILVTTYAAAM